MNYNLLYHALFLILFFYLKILLNYLLNGMLLTIRTFQLVEFGKVLLFTIFKLNIIFLMLYFL